MKAGAVAFFLLLSSMTPGVDSLAVEGWRGIVPLHSNRADVERLLGPMTDSCKCGYYLDDINVFFKYSPGDCKSGRGAWDVPPDTVVGISVYPKPRPRLSDLNIDQNKCEKRHDGHIESIVSYVNDEQGLIIEVDDERNVVMGFYYFPAAKEASSLSVGERRRSQRLRLTIHNGKIDPELGKRSHEQGSFEKVDGQVCNFT